MSMLGTIRPGTCGRPGNGHCDSECLAKKGEIRARGG